MSNNIFGVILYSKIQDHETFKIYADNLDSFFTHLAQSELISRVYFVDDSDPEFQNPLHNILSTLVTKTHPKIELVDVIDNGNIYNAVNRVWKEVKEEYVISFNSDQRLIQTLPLATIKKAFEKYPDVYLIHLIICGGWGYSNNLIKQELKKKYPYYRVFKDEEMTTWFCFDKEGRVYSLPEKLYSMQRAGILPKEAAQGFELIPRIIDAQNTLWTTKWPAKFLVSGTHMLRFQGNPAIFRTAIIKKYLPLPKRYSDESPAECQEGYFQKTDIDCKYYGGYLNLQDFAVLYKDLRRPHEVIERDYWESFLERNSVPITHQKIKHSNLIKNSNDIKKGIQFLLRCGYCCLETVLRWQLRNLAWVFLGKVRTRHLWHSLRKFMNWH
jgi:hypothetical protein